jgi:hypothetical protein
MYTSAQLIAYEVPTGDGLPAGTCSLEDNKLVEDVQKDEVFQSALGKLSDDAKGRVCRMLAVIDLAFSSNAPSMEKNVLKVFMAPEFYFRPRLGDKARSYDATDMIAAQQLFRVVFSQAKLRDWLFVAGSLVWNVKGKVASSSATVSGVPQRYLDALAALADKDTVYNTVLVGLGGWGVQLYDKVHYSGADDIAEKWRPLKTYCLQSPSQSLVAADTLLIGLEVCYDHECGVLQASYRRFKQTYPANDPQNAAPKLDLQLLTACGMTVQKNRIAAGAKTLVFRVDGTQGAADNGRFDHSEIQAVLSLPNRGTGAETMLDPASDLDGWTALNEVLQEVELQGDYAMSPRGLEESVWRAPANANAKPQLVTQDLGTSFKQKLRVYSPTPLVYDAA